MPKTKLLKAINLFYVIIVALFFLDQLDSFDIKNQIIKSVTYYSVLVLTPVLFFYYLIMTYTTKKRTAHTVLVGLIFTFIVIIGPLKIVFSTSAWETQTVVYKHGHLNFRAVEYQMKDVGAFGYNKRTVEVLYLTPWFITVSPVINNIDKRVEWIRVDEDVNELGIKMP